MLLKTRLFKPSFKEGYLLRSRLLKSFKTNWYKPIHLVTAGAGYGKTILVSHWLDKIKENYSWISLENDCNDLRTFLIYLAESFRLKLHSKRSLLAQMTDMPELPLLKEIEKEILREINQLQSNHVFVFDDYHVIDNDAIHQIMSNMIRNLPDHTKIIIISRYDPPLNLSREKIYDKISEIGFEEMKFRQEEIEELSRKVFDLHIRQEDLKGVLQISEGWIIPIRLLLRNYDMADWREKLNSMALIKGMDLSSYLMEDVLKIESSLIREVLMIASIFERFNLEMLYEIYVDLHPEYTDDHSSFQDEVQKIIDRSEFIISVDPKRIWYRFHHLIKDFLNFRLVNRRSQENKNKILIAGSNYLESSEFYSEAIGLNISNGSFLSAIHIVKRNRKKFANLNRFNILQQWVELFPQEIVNENPDLLMIRIYLEELAQNFKGILIYSRQFEILLSGIDLPDDTLKTFSREHNAITSTLHLFKGDFKKTLDLLNEALKIDPVSYSYAHGYALAFKSITLVIMGKESEARKFLEVNRRSLSSRETMLHLHNNLAFSIVEFITANIQKLLALAVSTRKTARKTSNYPVLVMSDYYIAYSYYIMDELDAMEFYLNEGINNPYITRPGWIIHLYYLKCLHLLAEARDSEFWQCLHELETFAQSRKPLDFSNEIYLMKAELYIRRGDLQSIQELLGKVDFDQIYMVHRYLCPRLTRIRIFILIGDSAHRNKAQELLLQYERDAKSQCNKTVLLQIWCLQSVLWTEEEDIPKALDKLRSLFRETKKENVIRLYTDAGQTMRFLLEKMDDASKTDPHFNAIMRSFKKQDQCRQKAQVTRRLNNISIVFKNLTETEKDLLELASQGFRNKEIADKMHYSTGTVKTYLYNLYKKIEVKNRTQAILEWSEFKHHSINQL